ncbi:hypothetical protein MalM25_13270 [Planctomycetes bacterium MalM25]|nr:hypothetical protein MalM25_13270 [Planctomycetes bacterium MalM25]
MLAEIPAQQYRAILERCAEDLLWEGGVDAPPVDAYALAERLGMRVTQDRSLNSRARYARVGQRDGRGGVPTIVLAEEKRYERRHFAVAHEIGEAHAHRVYEALGVDPRETARDSREAIANALAGCLLAPGRWLAGLWRDADGDLYAIKEQFQTASHELLARRTLACVRAPLIVTVDDPGLTVWRRWNLSGPTPPRSRLESDCQRRAHETAELAWGDGADQAFWDAGLTGAPFTTVGPPIRRVRVWPIHEAGWRREITLTELMSEEPEWW